MKKELVLSKSRVLFITILSFVLITMIFLLIHRLLTFPKLQFSPGKEKYFILILLFSFVVHEFIHYLTALYFIKLKNRHFLKIGFSWKYFAPYCHCSKILKINQYRLVSFMPFIVLSIIPLILALVLHSSLLLIFSYISALGCAGDLYMLIKLVRYKNDLLIEDHPSKIGCILYQENVSE